MKKPQDTQAAAAIFGVELETQIPINAVGPVGMYHNGNQVHEGRTPMRTTIAAPHFGSLRWESQRDGSIRCDSGFEACEFVSPRLHGANGLQALLSFVGFMGAIGAKVNSSCGCHVTVSIPSIIRSYDIKDVAVFVRKLIRVADFHALAIYAQTGTNRHQNRYCTRPNPQAASASNELLYDVSVPAARPSAKVQAACGRGMLNLGKAFCGDMRNSTVEFRAFAGTLNISKVLHHLATVFGICRKVHTMRLREWESKYTKLNVPNANKAMRLLWTALGWGGKPNTRNANSPAFGLFGTLYTEIGDMTKTAMKMAKKFEAQYPAAFAVVRQPVQAQPQPENFSTPNV